MQVNVSSLRDQCCDPKYTNLEASATEINRVYFQSKRGFDLDARLICKTSMSSHIQNIIAACSRVPISKAEKRSNRKIKYGFMNTQGSLK